MLTSILIFLQTTSQKIYDILVGASLWCVYYMTEAVNQLVGFYGTSTFVGYLMPNPFSVNNQFYFKQFSLT